MRLLFLLVCVGTITWTSCQSKSADKLRILFYPWSDLTPGILSKYDLTLVNGVDIPMYSFQLDEKVSVSISLNFKKDKVLKQNWSINLSAVSEEEVSHYLADNHFLVKSNQCYKHEVGNSFIVYSMVYNQLYECVIAADNELTISYYLPVRLREIEEE